MNELIKQIIGEKKIDFIIIREGKIGLECWSDPKIKQLSKAHKELIKAFLNGVIEELK